MAWLAVVALLLHGAATPWASNSPQPVDPKLSALLADLIICHGAAGGTEKAVDNQERPADAEADGSCKACLGSCLWLSPPSATGLSIGRALIAKPIAFDEAIVGPERRTTATGFPRGPPAVG